MSSGGGASGPDATGGLRPRAPLGHLSRLGFALRDAHDLDQVARSLLADLVSLPDVSRVGLALTEGGGRRLRFVATDKMGGADLEWCHIDAYDDVPLTAVTRIGEPVFGSLDDLEPRFPGVVAHQREEGTHALGAWPLPGIGSPVGGIVLFFDRPQAFGEPQQRLLAAAADRTADAVRRVRIATGRGPGEVAPDDLSLAGQGERVAVLLENDPRAPGAARRFLREALAEWGVDEDAAGTAELCLSELVTNVVMHARTTSELIAAFEDRVLTVVVRDLGGSSRSGDPTTIAISDDDDDLQVFGRGLVLVDALADRWGSEQDATGTTAWFALELGNA